MISDNGTKFVGAVNELKDLVGQLDQDKIHGMTAQKGFLFQITATIILHFDLPQQFTHELFHIYFTPLKHLPTINFLSLPWF